MPVSNEFTIRFRAPGSTVIDQMVSRMVSEGVAYSFELSEPDWRFLGENNASRTPPTGTQYKPPGTVEINDFISPWGEATISPISDESYRAFAGGPDLLTVNSLLWTARAWWDTAGDQMWYTAGSTGSDDVKQNLVKYNAETDQFLHWTSGGPLDGSDSEASLWPGRGAPHNFGLAAWDQQRRRLYKLQRLPSPLGTTFWPCWVDVAREQSYATRAEWVVGRDTWFSSHATGYDFRVLWPQVIFAPDMGTSGSLIVLPSSNRLLRWDCATWAMTEYDLDFNLLTPLTGRSATDALSRRGASLVYHDGYMYCASHDTGTGFQFWRFALPADGSTPTIEVRANCPVAMDLAGYGWPGTHTELCVLNGSIYAFHADMWGDNGERDWAGGVYRYNVTADSWSPMLAGSESWSAKLIALGLTPTIGLQNFIVTEIPRLGAFLMVQTITSTLFKAWLFKPLS